MRIFLDTNVLASGFATRGLCEDVVRKTLMSHQLVISAPLLKELERVLQKKFNVSKEVVRDVLKMIRSDARIGKPTPVLEIEIKDKDDIVILSSAINGKADIFVTGDKELLGLERLDKMLIISPRQLWGKLNKS